MIKNLSKEIISKIAAGEVIENVSSVIKELVENSIDAKSDKIIIKLKDQGRKSIEVIDNGIGMNLQDLKLCHKRYTTSKIQDFNDLFNLNTLGFRGEALYSIKQVSNLTIESKTKDNEIGNGVEIITDKNIERYYKKAMTQGTRIIVEDLFYNIPVRKNVINKANQLNKVVDLIIRFSLLYPNIEFRLFNNNKEILITKKTSNPLNTITQVFGYKTSKDFINVNYLKNNVEIIGYISKPNIKQRNKINYIFINNRIVDMFELNKPILDAYKGLMFLENKPNFILYINVPKDKIDVNIHPKKLKIMIKDINIRYEIYNAVKTTLSSSDLIKNIDINSMNKKTSFDKTKLTLKEQIHYFDDQSKIESKINEIKQNKIYNETENETKIYSDNDLNKFLESNVINNKNNNSDTIFVSFNNKKLKIKILGQIFDTFIVLDVLEDDKKAFYLVDQHVAEERYNYEYLKSLKSFEKQILLEPIILDLNNQQKIILDENKDLFNKIGFEFDNFGKNMIELNKIPLFLSKRFINSKFNINQINSKNLIEISKELFYEILNELIQENDYIKKTQINVFDNLLKSISCKMSIKAKTKLSKDYIKTMILNLFKCKEPFFCPHGRPVIIRFYEKDLYKMFKRMN